MIVPRRDYAERHSRPALWMHYASELGRLARTFDPAWRSNSDPTRTRDVQTVFANCTRQIPVAEEARARDLYWSAVTGGLTTMTLRHATSP